MNEEFVCDSCAGHFLKSRSDEEALIEAEKFYPVRFPKEQMRILCDNCFQEFKKWYLTDGTEEEA